MRRLLFLVLFSCAFMSFVDFPLSAQTKLTPEELAFRKEKAAGDPVRLLELIPLAEPTAASDLRRRVGKLLAESPPAERDELSRKIAALLAAAARTQDEAQELFGPPQKISRQLVYRRYIEQWIYDRPLPLCLNWHTPSGQELQTLTVHPISGKNR